MPNTSLNARVNTVSGSSINDGETSTQNSFVNDGLFNDILLEDDNYFDAPQIICSKANEDAELGGAKSFRMDVAMASENPNLSPVFDTDRMSATLISSRINSPANANSALLPTGDEHDAVYISKIAALTNPSTSIKLMFSGYRPPNTFIKPLYRVLPKGSTESIENLGFQYFPTTEATIPSTEEEEVYRDYEYEVTGLDYTQYQIKILLISSNQAYTPIIKDLRGIALAV
ncbi:virion structural protein [Synechococcus phage ACG-2014b]|nr:virion structural protein [Synechococcus phage ACG-2014b]